MMIDWLPSIDTPIPVIVASASMTVECVCIGYERREFNLSQYRSFWPLLPAPSRVSFCPYQCSYATLCTQWIGLFLNEYSLASRRQTAANACILYRIVRLIDAACFVLILIFVRSHGICNCPVKVIRVNTAACRESVLAPTYASQPETQYSHRMHLLWSLF